MMYPFTAIVGQGSMKRALLACVVDPALHGVLVTGERGTAKSTAVRGLTQLLPEQEVVLGCEVGCDPENTDALCAQCVARRNAGERLETGKRRMPLVDLPVGATEDRVLGTVDVERALKEGVEAFRPGLLARVHRGILYIDEVNLLGDHLMDVLLDAAAMGVNHLEREGVSHFHPSRFILVGTMNPEEGNLRPQLTDRFDLGVTVGGMSTVAERRRVLQRRLQFERDPEGFAREFEGDEHALARRVRRAQERLDSVIVDDAILDLACLLASELHLHGHRAEIATVKAAKALAALDGEDRVTDEHFRQASRMAVTHRLRRSPLDDPEEDAGHIEKVLERLSQREDQGSDEERRSGGAEKKTDR